ncbi:dipeptide/oligopeptide/nickel ABC transporter permease/ATP-binding protein [Catelliglobosispora koreensis]|uniref:dipeptide/oligopeptide/nickel ABC transporter permease/ATP-binding protein n=1 Tax=Catelliglobosispora koreensis TaxID=129052 RepID=UPI000376FFE7|nr:dipeptide/oligopeptide/nickel ABC transporter permease/ATP-binding protein [Catelliglobosispora koreensis]
MRRVRWNAPLILGLTATAVLIVIAIIAPWVWGERAEQTDYSATHQSASAAHWFGTDLFGRDVFARTMVATRPTLLMAFAAMLIASVGGIIAGSVIWVSGPRVREIGQRVIDILISYPSVLFALVIAAILQPGAVTSVVAIGLATCPAFARLTTNLAASVATRDFVSTSRLLGVGPLRLLRRHILPNIAEPLLVLMSVAFTISLKALTGLSVLGVGLQAPAYDWGSLLAKGLEGIYVNAWPALGPSIAIVVAGLAGGFIGDGLAAAANPASSRRVPKRTMKAALAAASASVPGAPPLLRGDEVVPAEDVGVVAVRGLSVVMADGTRLVDEVSFTVGEGEIVGVVGESGSGKSLTAMALARLLAEGLRAEANQLSVAGHNLLGRPPREKLAKDIGIVYQDPASSFNPTMKVGSQLTETLRVHGGVSRGKAAARAIEQLTLARVSRPELRIKQHPHELSGGMRQRAMIASALLTSPKLLIADEPTTALDVTVQADVLRLLREANTRDGVTILLISHDIGVVSAICDRVLVMYAGRIAEELSVEDLRAGNARHPYTRALLAATPKVTETSGELAPIPGRPPQPAQRPSGCAFAPRCPLAQDVCVEERPALMRIGTGAAACHALTWQPVGVQ